jgi:peptidoglycan L-alanyl-D-glutamate endopeptidase CwlK
MTKTREERNAIAIAGLHPEFAKRVRVLIERTDAEEMAICIVQGLRSREDQAELYAKGRLTTGPIVTNAPPGWSYHEYGLAVDVVDFASSGDLDSYDGTDWGATNYARIGAIGKEIGLEWGGIWRNTDLPHLEFHPGFGPRDARWLFRWTKADGRLPDDFFIGDVRT